jgi:glycosyltransferase involved in cell wall biosynthesis
MKIFFFINSLAAGGAERVTVNLANYWNAKGFKIYLVSICPISQDFYFVHPNITRISLDLEDDNRNTWWSFKQKLKTIILLRSLIKKITPGVALSMMTDANILLSISTIGLKGINLIGSERIYPPLFLNKKKHWEWLRKYTYYRFNCMVALTEENLKWLSENTLSKYIKVIPNPLILPLPKINPILNPENYLNPKRKYLLAVGRFHKQKQFDLLIRLFNEVATDFKDWNLIILGEGSERQILEHLVAEFELEDRVVLPGLAGNLREWYQGVDAFVMTSAFEGFPNTLLEAMGHGLPVVSFDCDTGPRNLIENEKNGLLIPNQDFTAMENGLRKLLLDKNLRQLLGDQAKQVQDKFSISRIAAQWEELF